MQREQKRKGKERNEWKERTYVATLLIKASSSSSSCRPFPLAATGGARGDEEDKDDRLFSFRGEEDDEGKAEGRFSAPPTPVSAFATAAVNDVDDDGKVEERRVDTSEGEVTEREEKR